MSSPYKKNFRIAALKQRVDRSQARGEKTCKVLEHAIYEIYNCNASGLSFEELYSECYHMVLQKYGEKLYNGLWTNPVVGKGLGTENLDNHNKSLQIIRDIFMYMDRTFIPNARKTSVHDVGLHPSRSHSKRADWPSINRNLMRNMTKMLIDLGSSVYQEDFEKPFLEASASFYNCESQQLH
ncbi:hypothetical protein KFK09_014338 [Dendrobium nobile]|uniref:Cullin N-terminal domain-containing protein n=1 Tax=Dendrobium nobile TaxID=94219 RepID=A0A8T3B9L0_DENNO|nr:hypothetical protein KFK09_014338 [Dendrobium nobile]